MGAPATNSNPETGFLRARVRPLGLVVAAGSVACVCSITGFAGRAGWLFDLTAHFRMQYAAGLLVFGVGLLLARHWKLATFFLACAALNLAVVLPPFLAQRHQVLPSRDPLRLMLLNVHTENQQFARVRQQIQATRPALVVFEEVDARWLAELAPLQNEYPYRLAEPREDNFGIALFSRVPWLSSNVVYLGSAEIPSLLVTLEFHGHPLTVLGTHPLPPASRENTRLRDAQLAAIPPLLARSKGSVILLGDLNTTPWSHVFSRLLREAGLVDSSRGFGWQPTWPAPFWPLRIPIDHCLLSPDLHVLRRQVGPGLGSDHLPLTLEVAIP